MTAARASRRGSEEADGRTDGRTDEGGHLLALRGKMCSFGVGANSQISSDNELFSTHFDHHSQWFFEM